MIEQRKGFLKRQYTLVSVDAINYTVYKGDPYMYPPDLLSLGEFKRGKEGLALYDHIKNKLTFGPEKFGDLLKRK